MKRTAWRIANFHYQMTVWSSIGFFVMVLLSVLSRFVFKTPIFFATELSRILFVWACFFGAAMALEQRAHITLTLLTDRFSSAMIHRFFHAFSNLMIMLFLVVVFFTSISVILDLWVTTLPITGWTQAVFYLPLPLISLTGCWFCYSELTGYKAQAQ
jgi:TRAP-type C4-dicarboxylate transport system permease small subunit